LKIEVEVGGAMSDEQLCPRCREELPADAPGGLCPACLLQAARGPCDSALPPGPEVRQGDSFLALWAAEAVDRQDVLGDFRIIREIGRGGMGVVYEAHQTSLNRRVALKVLPLAVATDARPLQRFQMEAQVVANLNHPNIVPVYAIGCDRGLHHYAMKLIDGRNLREVIRELRLLFGRDASTLDVNTSEVTRSFVEGRFDPDASPRQPGTEPKREPDDAPSPPPQNDCAPAASPAPGPAFFRSVARFGAQAAEALNHVHDLGILHRDIKPANLIVDIGGDLWVTDFGLARLQGAGEITRTGDVVGTLRYMSPEQALGLRGRVDRRSDVYSLGMTLYELLTLQPAFDGDDRQELLRRIVGETPCPPRRLNPTIPSDLQAIVLKSLAKEPELRYDSARDLADDLKRLLSGESVHARPQGLLTYLGRWLVSPNRIRDAGLMSMSYGGLFIVWSLFGLLLLVLGLLPRPDRPAEFARDIVLVMIGNYFAAIWLGWKMLRGRAWAVRAGTALTALLIILQVRCLMGYPPHFGGFYDDPRVRTMWLSCLVIVSGILALADLLALLALRAGRLPKPAEGRS
jgi:serine/threonine protein kinase